jgi:hypothetical protein
MLAGPGLGPSLLLGIRRLRADVRVPGDRGLRGIRDKKEDPGRGIPALWTPGREIGMKKPKIYVLVKNFAWTNQDVELFRTAKEAKRAFEQYTGFAFNDEYLNQDDEEYNEKFSETKIYELDLPDFLRLKEDGVHDEEKK